MSFFIILKIRQAQREWDSLFEIDDTMIPKRLLTPSIAQKVLFIGKAGRVLNRSKRWTARLDESCGEQLQLLANCFSAKAPPIVVEMCVEAIRKEVAYRLRELLVEGEDAPLGQAVTDLKGVYLLGHGNFYQTFLQGAADCFSVAPVVSSESELVSGAWSVAVRENDEFAKMLADFTPKVLPTEIALDRFSAADTSGLFCVLGGASIKNDELELPVSVPSPACWTNQTQFVLDGFQTQLEFTLSPPFSEGTGGKVALCFQNQTKPSSMKGVGEVKNFPQLPSCLSIVASYSCVRPQPGAKSKIDGDVVVRLSLAIYFTTQNAGPGQQLHIKTLLAPVFSKLVVVNASSYFTFGVHYDSDTKKIVARVHPSKNGPQSETSGQLHFVGNETINDFGNGLIEVGADFDISQVGLELGACHVGIARVPVQYDISATLLQRDKLSGLVNDTDYWHPSVTGCRESRDRPIQILALHHEPANKSFSSKLQFVQQELAFRAQPQNEHIAAEDPWLSALRLAYAPTWPLPLIITSASIAKYNELFAFLLHVRKAYVSLQDLWLDEELIDGENAREMHCLRTQMAFFTREFWLYLQQDVVEVEFARLQDKIKRSIDFEELRNSHEHFLTRCLVHFFLRAAELKCLLLDILEQCHRFVDLVIDGRAQERENSFELDEIRVVFLEQVRKVLDHMSSLAEQNMHPYLSQLLLRIDYNHFFAASGHDQSQGPFPHLASQHDFYGTDMSQSEADTVGDMNSQATSQMGSRPPSPPRGATPGNNFNNAFDSKFGEGRGRQSPLLQRPVNENLTSKLLPPQRGISTGSDWPQLLRQPSPSLTAVRDTGPMKVNELLSSRPPKNSSGGLLSSTLPTNLTDRVFQNQADAYNQPSPSNHFTSGLGGIGMPTRGISPVRPSAAANDAVRQYQEAKAERLRHFQQGVDVERDPMSAARSMLQSQDGQQPSMSASFQQSS